MGLTALRAHSVRGFTLLKKNNTLLRDRNSNEEASTAEVTTIRTSEEREPGLLRQEEPTKDKDGASREHSAHGNSSVGSATQRKRKSCLWKSSNSNLDTKGRHTTRPNSSNNKRSTRHQDNKSSKYSTHRSSSNLLNKFLTVTLANSPFSSSNSLNQGRISTPLNRLLIFRTRFTRRKRRRSKKRRSNALPSFSNWEQIEERVYSAISLNVRKTWS